MGSQVLTNILLLLISSGIGVMIKILFGISSRQNSTDLKVEKHGVRLDYIEKDMQEQKTNIDNLKIKVA